ncbi:MAG: glycosyltransferase family 2 protein [Chitinophagales bacterium]|nr:glycosyltransferase family 2 protein [Chitinophagales bacterium]
MKAIYTYSLVIPVYNSVDSLRLLVDEIAKVFRPEEYQIILVDDHSSDNSWELMKTLKAESKLNISLISLAQNAGQHIALFCGLMHAKGEFIITLDDDLQHRPDEIIKLVNKAVEDEADLVYGIYEQKKHSAIRNSGSKFFGNILNRFASSPAQGSSFKLIRRELVLKVIQHQHFNFYLDEVLAWYSAKTSYVTVIHAPRLNGKSGYSNFKLMEMSLRLLFNYTVLPLKFITYFGLVSSLTSFGFGVYYIVEKINNGAQSGFTAIIVSIFFSTGLILLSLGIIGEYISRVFRIQSGKPPFKIKALIE